MKLKHVVNESGQSKTVIFEEVHFNRNEITKYKDLFHSLISDKPIIMASFEDNKWHIYCFISNLYRPISFVLEIYKELQLALKCYTVAQLTLGKRMDIVSQKIRLLTEVILSTDGLKNINKFQKYISLLIKTNPVKCYNSSRELINFLSFYKVDHYGEFIDICLPLKRMNSKNRELPHFHDVINYDSIVNQYFRDTPIEENFKFKPIQLWWCLTNIIPMRPSEFLLIPFNCIEKDIDNLCWITVPRIKDPADSPYEVISSDALRYQTFQISQEMFQLISEFKLRLLKINIDPQYLFPLQFYKTTFDTKLNRKSNAVEDRINTNQFSRYLLKFYKQVIINIYNEQFEKKILPSNTRHFAIINMFLQGFNLLSIARMAGHLDLNSSDNYYSHAKEFAKSYVYNFVTTNMGQSIGKKMSDGLIGWRRDVIDKGKMYKQEDISGFIKVDHGYCKDKQFPNNCGEHCGPCPFFIFQPSINDFDKAIEWLDNYSIELETDIDLTLESMIETSKSIKYLTTPNKEEAFISKARELQVYLDHKIRTDTLLSGLKEGIN